MQVRVLNTKCGLSWACRAAIRGAHLLALEPEPGRVLPAQGDEEVLEGAGQDRDFLRSARVTRSEILVQARDAPDLVGELPHRPRDAGERQPGKERHQGKGGQQDRGEDSHGLAGEQLVAFGIGEIGEPPLGVGEVGQEDHRSGRQAAPVFQVGGAARCPR